jgi:hypothetical protein
LFTIPTTHSHYQVTVKQLTSVVFPLLVELCLEHINFKSVKIKPHDSVGHSKAIESTNNKNKMANFD